MAEILTESFCERCGSRYTFEAAAARRRRLGRVRTLSRGLKNFVANDDASFSDAMALAREENERKASLQQLDAFHRTFSFCMTCRQYTCRNCWNSAAGECLTCAPDLSREVLPAAFPDLTVVGPESAAMASAEASPPTFAATAWPSMDVRVEAAPPSLVAVPGPPAADAAPNVAVAAEAALVAPSEVAPAVEILTTPEAATAAAIPLAFQAAPATEIPLTIDTTSQAEAAPEFAAQAEAAVTVEADLEAAPEFAAQAHVAVAPEPGVEQVEALPAEAAAAPSFGSTDESDLELTATELTAVEDALNRQVQQAESAAVASGTPDAIPAPETGTTGQEEPVVGGQAETRRFFQRFRLRRGQPATTVSAIPMAATSGTATITPPPALDATLKAASAPEPEPVAVEVVVAAPGVVPEPEPVAVEVAATVPELTLEPEPVKVVAAAVVAAPELTLEPEPLVVEVEAAPEVVPESEPVAVEVAATAQEPTPEPEPAAAAAAAAAAEPEPEPEPRPQPVDVVKQPTWRMVAPDGTAAGEAEPAPPIWTTPSTVTRRPAEPMPTAGWASRVATARPVESPVWVASSRDVVAAARPGVAAPVGIHSCVSCGLSLSANARFCRRCGSRQG